MNGELKKSENQAQSLDKWMKFPFNNIVINIRNQLPVDSLRLSKILLKSLTRGRWLRRSSTTTSRIMQAPRDTVSRTSTVDRTVGAAGSTSHAPSQIITPDQIWFTSRTNCIIRRCAVRHCVVTYAYKKS